ncbi:ASCH domain-containing protein [Streptomyces sp. NPDC046465]|uniref:ASCH domain-containing protein n=1 Tax=Streptomyces sp. NPDC046465 TaxID=3155810 RepID=UPI0033C325B0
MKALTIKQPWADAIAHSTKRTENRTWTTRYRGPILIHAGGAYDQTAGRTVSDLAALHSWPDYRGAIIATATLADIHVADGCCAPWGEPDVYHWQLAGVHALPEPVLTKGRQQLWNPAPAIIRAALDQIEEDAS